MTRQPTAALCHGNIITFSGSIKELRGHKNSDRESSDVWIWHCQHKRNPGTSSPSAQSDGTESEPTNKIKIRLNTTLQTAEYMQRCNGSGCLWKTDILYCPITLSIMCDWLSNPWYTWMNVAYVITQITFSPACLTAIKNKIFNIWFLINISVFSSHPLKANLSTCLGIRTVKPRRPLYFFTTADERNAVWELALNYRR